MAEQKFKEKAQEMIEQMVNAIADKEYTKLVSSIPPKTEWASLIDAEPTPENACLGFAKWLVEQLALWEEDEEKKFTVDHFSPSCVSKIDDEADEARLASQNFTMVCYDPTSFGERLDFWFEIEFSMENGQLTAEFDINI